MMIDERIGFPGWSSEYHDRQIGEPTDAITELSALTNEDVSAIRTLARIAEAREKRIFQPEENR